MKFKAGWRHERRWRRLQCLPDWWDPPDPSKPLAEMIEDHELLSRLPACISRLGPTERKLVRMRFGLGNEEDLTLETIAHRLGVTRQAVYKRIQTILSRLRQLIEQPVVKN